MARKATGQVIAPDGDRQRSWALRFRAYGERRFVTLGRPEDGWSRERAETKLRHVLADIERGIWQADKPSPEPPESKPEQTFHEFATRWYREREPGWRPNTRADYLWALERHLLPFFKDYRLSQIDAESIDRYAAAGLREGERRRAAIEAGRPIRDRDGNVLRPFGANSINKTLTRLAQILEVAVDYERIPRNPAKGKKRRLKGETRSRPHVEPEQLPSLLDGCGGALRILLATLAGAGLRIGEAIALTWGDVNLADGTLRVKDSKTEAGVRVIDLADGLAGELRVYKARSHKTAPTDPVFRKLDGSPQSVRNAQARLKPAIRKANRRLAKLGIELISEDVGPHGLRRTYASMRFAAGDDPVYVANQLGHAEAGFSMKVYARAVKRRGRLSGDTQREFDRAIEWAGMGREATELSVEDRASGSPERVAR